MSDPVVYKGTPLGDYFEGMPYSMEAGVIVGTGTFETDYGVSSDHETYSYSPTTSENDGPVHDFAPPSTLPRKRFTSSKVPKPLIILNEDISRSTKFYNLFSVRALVPIHLPYYPVCPLALLTIDLLQSQRPTSRNSPFPRASPLHNLHLPTPLRKTHSISLPNLCRRRLHRRYRVP